MLEKIRKKIRWHDKFTVMIVPHTKSSIKKVHFSKMLVLCGAALLTIALIVSSAFALHYSHRYKQMEKDTVELGYLRELTKEQEEKIEVLVAETQEIYKQMEQLHQLDKQVRRILNLEKADEVSVMEEIHDSEEMVLAVNSSRETEAKGTVTRGAGREDLFRVEHVLTNFKMEAEAVEKNLEVLIDEAEKYVAYKAAKPSGWPVSGRITSSFGLRRSPTGRGTEFHTGVDIAAPHGATIRATGAGRVVSAGWQGGYGRTVVIDHGYGYRTLYAHASRLTVGTGERVSRGTVVGYVGTTGRTTGPHVHYEVFYRGENVNPTPFL